MYLDMGEGDLLIWSREEEGRFPDSAELKRLVRDVVAPSKDLGHSEGRYGLESDKPPSARNAVERLVSLLSSRRQSQHTPNRAQKHTRAC